MNFNVISALNGRSYSIGRDDVDSFYGEHILGAVVTTTTSSGLSVVRNAMVSPVKTVGTVLLKLFNPNGDLVNCSMGFNTVTTAGKGWVVDRLQTTASTPAIMDYQAIGSGTTASAVGDTALQTELARGQGTLSQPTATTDRLVTTFAAGTGTGTITETGRLNASSSGILYARLVFSAVTKASDDSLTVTHDITVS